MLKSFYPCFKLGLDLSHQRETLDGPEENDLQAGGEQAGKYRAAMLEKLTQAEHRVMARWGPETAGVARRMVTVWLDELLIKTPWPGRGDWLRKPLQSQWGEGRSGGLWFFRELEGLNPARQDDRELAALALRCVSLGLTGCYGRDPDGLNQVRREILDRFAFKDDTPVFPPPPLERKRKIISAPDRRWLAAVLVTPLLFWVLSGLSLDRALEEALDNAKPAAVEEPPAPNSLYGNLPDSSRPVEPGEKL